MLPRGGLWRPSSLRILAAAPQVVLFIGGFLVPFGLLVATSMATMRNYRLTFALSGESYAKLFASDAFWTALYGSVTCAVAAALLTALAALPISLFLVLRASPRTRAVIVAVLLLPLLTNYVVRAYALKITLANNGVVNYLLGVVGLGPYKLLYSLPAMYFSYVVYFTAVAVLAQWAGAGRLAPPYLSAAADLGAGWWYRTSRIALPLAARGLALQSAVVYAFSFSDTLIPQTIGGNSVYTLGSLLVDYFKINDWPRAAATSIVMMGVALPMLIACLVIGVRISREAEWLGAR